MYITYCTSTRLLKWANFLTVPLRILHMVALMTQNKTALNDFNVHLQKQHFPTFVFSGHFDGHQLFNEDKVLLHTGDVLPGWKHGSRIWRLWLTGQQPCRLTLQRIYFVVQNKEHRRKKNSQDISMWMSCVQSSLFSVLLAVLLEQTKVVLDLWLPAHCVRDIFLANSLIQ